MQPIQRFEDAEGRRFSVPEAELDAFRADTPDAVAVHSFADAEGRSYSVPDPELEAFGREVPGAQRVRKVQAADGSRYSVPDSERQDFIKRFRTGEEFEADRTAITSEVEQQAAAAPDESYVGKSWSRTLGEVPEAAAQGWRMNRRLIAGGDIVTGGRPATDAAALMAEDEADSTRGEPGTFFQEAVTGAARLAGQMGEMQPRAAIIGGGVALGSALVTRGAGAVPGFKAGYTTSLALDAYKQGAGDIYFELLRGGADPERGRLAAGALAVPYGVIGMLQLKGLLPRSGATVRVLRQRVMDAARTWLVNTTGEAAGEAGQKLLTSGASSIDRILRGVVPEGKRGQEVLKVAKDTAREFAGTFGPMGLLQIPGGAVNVARNGRTMAPAEAGAGSYGSQRTADRGESKAGTPGMAQVAPVAPMPVEAPVRPVDVPVATPPPLAPPIAPGLTTAEVQPPVAPVEVQPVERMRRRDENEQEWQQGAAKAAEAANVTKRDRWEAVTPQEDVRVAGHWTVVDADNLLTSDTQGYIDAFQPRDRDTFESKKQIASIASKPDPTRLDQDAMTDGGAPLVWGDSRVMITGNGRIIGLRQAYDAGTAGEYRGYVLAVANGMGIDPADLTRMEKPILVRVAEGLDEKQAAHVAELSNRPPTLQMTAAEKAVADAAVVVGKDLLAIYNPDADGNIRTGGNREFLERFVDATGDGSLRKKNGDFAPEIDTRVKGAILHTLLGDNEQNRIVTRELVEDSEGLGVTRQVNGILTGARDLLRVRRERADYDLLPSLGQALARVVHFKKLKLSGAERGDFANFQRQDDMFADPDSQDALADALALHLAESRSVKAIQTLLANYARLAQNQAPAGESLFEDTGDVQNTRRSDILNRAIELGEAADADGQTELEIAPRKVRGNAKAQPGPAAADAGPGGAGGGDNVDVGRGAGTGTEEAAGAGVDPVESAARRALGMDEAVAALAGEAEMAPASLDYRGEHIAPTGEFGEGSLDAMDRTYPLDIYDADAARIYGDGSDPRLDAKAIVIIRKLRGKPDAKVKVYRSVPKGVQAEIVPGDWVTPIKEYAVSHGERFDNGMDIIERTVLAREVFTEGNSLFEFGWQPAGAEPIAPSAREAVSGPNAARPEAGEPAPIVQEGAPLAGLTTGAQRYDAAVDTYRKAVDALAKIEEQYKNKQVDADAVEAAQRAVDYAAAAIERAEAGLDVTIAGNDIDAAARKKAQSGAVAIPAGLPEGMRAGLRRLGNLFTPHRGVGEQAYGLYNQMKRSLEAARLQGREERNRIRQIVTDLEGAHGRDTVMQALRDVEDGKLTPAEFSKRFGLAPRNTAERFLGVMVRETERMSQKILAWKGRSQEARKAAENMHFYQTRAYLVHALGEGYMPAPDARRAAVLQIEAGLADAVKRLAGRATAVRGKRGGLDVINWLETGDETFIRHASPTRAAAARVLRTQWLELRGMIDGLAVEGDQVTAQANADAVARAANGYVDFYLSRSKQRGNGGGPGVETAHLRHRFLEGAFRQLYGEVTDPAYRQQITREVQARMLAEMSFFERMFAESEGSIWAMQPDTQKGIVVQLGDKGNAADRQRYGDMAGRFVTREFSELIDTEKNRGGTHRVMSAIYFTPMGIQRMGKLLAPKTISRNYITAITGLAMETGDLFLPGYWPAWGEGHRLAVDYARGKPDAIAKVRDLVELGVFQPGSSSYTADMQAALGTGGKRTSKIGKSITEAYTFIDFPTKYAAFQARQRAGMTSQQAAQHVQDMYQNRERTPQIVGKVSRIGLADYLSYTYDSGRMAVNSLKFAAKEARSGRVLPMFGWITARSIFALTSIQATQMLSKAAGTFYAEVGRLLRGKDDDDDKKGKAAITPLSGEQISSMRNLVMPYDVHAPLLAWREERGGKLNQVGYTIAGGQNAFPLEDIMLGAMQNPKHGEGFLEAVAQATVGLVDEGMYVDAWAKAIGGSSFDGKRTPTGKGLWQVRPGHEDPQRSTIIQDAVIGWIQDMAPTYPAQMWRDLVRKERDQDAGIENAGIFARRQPTNAEIVSRQHRLVRSYTMIQSEMNAAVRNSLRPHMQSLERTREIISQASKQQLEKGGVRPEVSDQAEEAQDVRERYIGAAVEVMKSARQIAPEWYDFNSSRLLLKEAGMPEAEAQQVMARMFGMDVGTKYTPRPEISPMRTKLYQQLTQ